MKLSLNSLKDRKAWEDAGITIPSYSVSEVAERTKKDPVWVHIGIGNIFRLFLSGIADELITKGLMNRGITCVEAFDYEIIDRIYRPHDHLSISVLLHSCGQIDYQILGSMAEAVKAEYSNPAEWKRLKEIFCNPGLQMVSFTITEKGYGVNRADIEQGPDQAGSAMAITAAMLWERYRCCKKPVAMVSMDNCSRNGQKLRNAVLAIAEGWRDRGFVDQDFLSYLADEEQAAFPWTMIDKITPRPSKTVSDMLEASGVEAMTPIVTSRNTYIAPFVNGEPDQYLVVEDHFPNGRPPLEQAGVYMTDRETVNKSERMKVTACLNPIHSALGPLGCLLGYHLFSDEMRDPDMLKLARQVGYTEGLPMVESPGILSPEIFLDQVIQERFPNPYLGDTTQRLSVDMSQIVGIRFGETIKAYMKRDGNAGKLIGIPLAIAGWLRYLLGTDDEGNPYELAPDPMLTELTTQLAGIIPGQPSSLQNQVHPILSNKSIFGIDLYEAGLGKMIEDMLRQQLEGNGAVRKTVHRYLEQLYRIRSYNITPGTMSTGIRNKITDVPGVLVGHCTIKNEDNHTGVTVILPGPDNCFTKKYTAAAYVHNGFGKSTGLIQIEELGTLETPIALTNTLNTGLVWDSVISYVLEMCRRNQVSAMSINPIVGECNDCRINQIQKRAVKKEHVFQAFAEAREDFEEGDVGAGAGTICYGFKGGIGSASRLIEIAGNTYTIGVLVQTNFGAMKDFMLDGKPVGDRISKEIVTNDITTNDIATNDITASRQNSTEIYKHPALSRLDQGSIMTILATDLPVTSRQLKRIIRRTAVGIARTGAYTGHGSGEVMIGFTTANRIPAGGEEQLLTLSMIPESRIDLAFQAAAEATHEAILNSMVCAETTRGLQGQTYHSLKEFL